MKWRALIVVVMLLAIVAAVIAGFFWLGDKTQFRPQVREVMKLINEGRADEVWRESSYLFRRSLNQDAFEDMAVRMNQTLGQFIRITDVLEASQSSSLAGRVGEVVVELEFENARTDGTFGFHKGKDGKWRLVGIAVTIPEELRAKADALEREYERIRAPDDVILQLGKILSDIRDGKAADVWSNAAKPFRDSISSARFVELNASNLDALGKYVRVLTVISSSQHPDKGRAKVNALVEFEKVRTNGLFGFVKEEDEDRWRLSFFKILIPEPVIPGRVPSSLEPVDPTIDNPTQPDPNPGAAP